MSALGIKRHARTLILSSLAVFVSLASSQEVVASATSQCEQEAAAAGLGDYPDLVRQYVIECVEQQQPGSRENLESSYRLPAPPSEPTASEPAPEPEVTTESESHAADDAAPLDQPPPTE